MKSRPSAPRTPSSRKKANAKSSKESLEDILEDMLKDMYWAEKHLLKTLPKMAKAAHHEELREAFERHRDETQLQVERIEKCFGILEIKPVAKKCEAMEGLAKEGAEVIEDHEKGHARDAALIAAAQKVEHYEISAYGTMRTMSTVLGKVQCAELFEESKDEEAETDVKLTLLAEKINQLAAEMEEEVA
jgi:ferritin-like metal-binding protein YciE